MERNSTEYHFLPADRFKISASHEMTTTTTMTMTSSRGDAAAVAADSEFSADDLELLMVWYSTRKSEREVLLITTALKYSALKYRTVKSTMRSSMPRVLRRVLHRSFSSQDDRLFAVVSGGSKGIGLSFTKALLSQSNQHVIALSRNHSEELQMLEQQYPGRLQWIQTDLENEDSIKSATSAVASTFPKVDTLINCAGILGNGSLSQPGPERTVSAITKDWLVKSFEVSKSKLSSYLSWNLKQSLIYLIMV